MSRASSQQSMQYSDNEMEQLRQQVLKKRSLAFVEDDQIMPLYNYLRTLKSQYLEEEKYLDARDANELMESCKDEYQYRKDEQNPNQSKDSIENTEAGRRKSEFQKKIQEYDEQTKEKVQALQQKQSQELEKFETEWRDVMPEKYRRPSKRLIDLRQTARSLGYAGKFEEANERQIEAQNLMQIEHEQAKQKLDHDYEEAKRKLLKKHNDELLNLQDICKQQRDLLESKMKATEQALENRKNVLYSKPATKQRSSKLQESPPQAQTRGTRKSNTFENDQRLPPLAPPNSGGSSTQRKRQIKPLNQPAKTPAQKAAPQPAHPPAAEPEQKSQENEDNKKEEAGVLEDQISNQANKVIDNVEAAKE